MSASYASPVDRVTFGEYRVVHRPDDLRPLYRFEGRITSDGSTPFHAEPGRYHLYAGWFCPWAQRTVITRSLAGLDDVVSLSYVHPERDGRGWAFREPTGVDPVNGFTLLRDAYDATEPRFDGHVSVPTLWDRARGVVVSNQYRTIGIDLATRFRHLATPVVCTYPARLAGEIEELDAWLGPAVNHGARAAVVDLDARGALRRAFADLDRRLAEQRYLLGSVLTEADVRLWVTLVRFDVGPNADRRIVDGLHEYPNLWAYARDLYAIPAFRDSTSFESFVRPAAVVPEWDAPAHRGGRAA
jgi:putative glutathione S-transferase